LYFSVLRGEFLFFLFFTTDYTEFTDLFTDFNSVNILVPGIPKSYF